MNLRLYVEAKAQNSQHDIEERSWRTNTTNFKNYQEATVIRTSYLSEKEESRSMEQNSKSRKETHINTSRQMNFDNGAKKTTGPR